MCVKYPQNDPIATKTKTKIGVAEDYGQTRPKQQPNICVFLTGLQHNFFFTWLRGGHLINAPFSKVLSYLIFVIFSELHSLLSLSLYIFIFFSPSLCLCVSLYLHPLSLSLYMFCFSFPSSSYYYSSFFFSSSFFLYVSIYLSIYHFSSPSLFMIMAPRRCKNSGREHWSE